MKILLTGGGTMGSVTPLLAVEEKIKMSGEPAEFLWLGTLDGPEKRAVTEAGINFQVISSGKLRRYFSVQNFVDPFRVLAGFFQARKVLKNFRPDIVLSAGAFVGVPVVWAAHFKGIPVIIHQQDVIPGLANKLSVGAASKITVALADSLPYFPAKKTSWIGNPVRPSIFTGDRARALTEFGLDQNLPTVLIVGGGTGSTFLNKVVEESLAGLVVFCQVINVTGVGKVSQNDLGPRYHAYEFLTDKMPDALAVADVVVSRAGFGFLTELAALGKTVVLVPMPGTHQEKNAVYFSQKNGAIVLDQPNLTAAALTLVVKNLLDNRSDRANLERNIKTVLKWGAEDAMIKLIQELTKQA